LKFGERDLTVKLHKTRAILCH